MKKLITALTVLAVSGASLYADPGDSGAAFLRIGVGAKPTALAEAYSGVSGEVLGLYYNPASLSSLEGYNFSFTHALWFEDISYSNIAAGMPLLNGYAALGINYLSSADIDKYDKDGNELSLSYSPTDLLVTAGYSQEIGSYSAGAAVKLISSEIDGDTAMAFALDMGAQRKFGEINTGLSFQNLGTKMTFRDEGDSLPMTVRLGASYPIEVKGFDILTMSEINYSKDVPFKLNAGVNADYPLNDIILSLRIGITSYAEGLDALAHLKTGFGVLYRDISFDYAMASFEDLGLTHRVSLGYSFN